MKLNKYYELLYRMSVSAENLAKVEKVKAVNRLSKYDTIYDDDFVDDIEIIQNHALVELVHHNIFVAYANNLKVGEKHDNVTLESTLDMLMSVIGKMKHYDVIHNHKNERINYIIYILFTMTDILQIMIYNDRNIYDWEFVIKNRIKNIIGGEQYDEIVKSTSN